MSPGRRRRAIAGALVVAVPLALGGCLGAYRASPEEPLGAGGLRPSREDRDAGLVGIVPGFEFRRYTGIAVARFAVTDPKVEDEGDRRTAAEMAAFFQRELVRRLRASGLFARVVDLTGTSPEPDQSAVLRLEGTLTRLGEGSQAARAMVGVFGGGRTRVQAELNFVDARTGQVAMVTADRREASIGVFGGESRDHLVESLDEMAQGLVRFLHRLSRGEAPRPE